MIYKRDANFPYPILSETSLSYREYSFDLDINVSESKDLYIFEVDMRLGSNFLDALVLEESASFYLVIQSKDNKVFPLNAYRDVQEIKVKKSRIALSSKTNIQVFLISTKNINMSENYELETFYDEYKEEINIPRNSLLAYSNVVEFNGDLKKPLDLFEKRVDGTIDSEILVESRSDVIVLTFKKKEFQFNNRSPHYLNPYIYIGLSRALTSFYYNNISDQELEYIDIREMIPPASELETKLYQLMKSKGVELLSIDTLDSVISLITDKPIEKFVNSIESEKLYGN